jgi:uncharacterized membrane protein
MGLDHVRDFVSPIPLGSGDFTESPDLFFTRWITHFCAPVFVFLAGTSAFLYGRKVSREVLRKFLWSRGVWLIFIELIVVHFAWTFDFNFWFVQVIWTIGVCMIILGIMIYTPRWFMIAFTTVMILGHNLLDNVHLNSLWWSLLHDQNWGYPIGNTFLMVVYPLIPWPAVMVLGYLVGEIFLEDEQSRNKKLQLYGMSTTIAFVLIRLINMYGDSNHWQSSDQGGLYTFIDFLDTTKYPPSLLFLAMTLGPAVMLLPRLERWKGWAMETLRTFGRVPFFYYVIHLFVGHILGIIYTGIVYDYWGILTFAPSKSWPENYNMNLVSAYVAWALLTLIMYFLCKWFSEVKKRRTEWWLKYL